MAHLSLIHNIHTGLYETTHSGITYCVPFELTLSLETYYKRWSQGNNGFGIVEKWYNDLGLENKKRITRTGNLPAEEDNGFRADREAE